MTVFLADELATVPPWCHDLAEADVPLESLVLPEAHVDLARQPWRLSWRADPRARPLADRHYNRQKVGAAQFVPPGRCLVLLTDEAEAVWVTSWPIAAYVKHAWAGAMVNSLFRREGGLLASDLITAAAAATRAHWPDLPPLGLISFVDPTKTRRKRDPGRCYRRAGWTHVGETAAGLLAFQLKPADFPEPLAARPRRDLLAAGGALCNATG